MALQPFNGELDPVSPSADLKPFTGTLDNPKTGVVRGAGDVALRLGQGALIGTKGIADSFGARNKVSEIAQAGVDKLEEYVSPSAKQQAQENAAMMKEAEGKGAIEQIKAAGKSFLNTPLDTVAQGFGTAVPVIAGALGAAAASPVLATAGGATAVTASLGGAMGAGITKSSIYDSVEQSYLDAGYSKEDAAKLASDAQNYTGKNADQIALGAGLGAIAGRTGIESVLVGNKPTGNLIRRTLGTAAAEGLPEAIQGGQERFASNTALNREGFNVDPMAGVIGQATLEGISGGAIGGATGALTGGKDKLVIDQSGLEADAALAEQKQAEYDAQQPAQPEPDEFTNFTQQVDADIEQRKIAAGIKKPTEAIPASDILGDENVSDTTNATTELANETITGSSDNIQGSLGDLPNQLAGRSDTGPIDNSTEASAQGSGSDQLNGNGIQGNDAIAILNGEDAVSRPFAQATDDFLPKIRSMTTDAKVISQIDEELKLRGITNVDSVNTPAERVDETAKGVQVDLRGSSNTPQVETPKKAKPKTSKPAKPKTLLATLRDIGGIKLSEKQDVTGEVKGFAPGGYNQVFKQTSNRSLKGLIESGDLDDYLPYNMRLESNGANDDAFDSTEAYDYLAYKIRNGESVLPYAVVEELQALAYQGDAAADVANELTEDEINEQLRIATDEERESATDARVFNTDSENSSAESGAGRESAAETNASQQAEVTDSNTDLLGDNTTAKQAVADAERAKDAKRNSGNDNQDTFTLTGSNSEADQAAAAGAQGLFAAPIKQQSNAEASTGEDVEENTANQSSNGQANDEVAKATEALTAAGVKGKEKLDTIKDVREGKVTAEEVADAYGEPATQKPKGNVDDFGEKLEGARKDMVRAMAKEYSDDELASLPLSKIWPITDVNLIENKTAAAIAWTAREEIPSKPRKPYALKVWVGKVKILRDIGRIVSKALEVNPELMLQKLKDAQLGQFKSKVALLEAIDRDAWKRIGKVEEYPNAYSYVDGVKQIKPMVRIDVDGVTTTYEASSVADVIDNVNEKLGKEKQEKRMAFEVRGSSKGGYFINKKGDKNYTKLKTFDSSKEAFEFLRNNYDEVVAAWDATKDRLNVKESDVRGKENRPRTGEDYRKGKDVSSEEFATTFGFRGIQFGEWVKQGGKDNDRQGALNAAYDALMDLANIAGVPPKAMSLEGTLGLSFGARGKGSAAAHFEPGNLVINLTKTQGAGTLAHEWFHALDNYFSRKRGGEKSMAEVKSQQAYREGNYITYKPEALYINKNYGNKGITKAELERYRKQSPNSKYWSEENWILDPKHPQGVRPEVEVRFADLVDALNTSPMKQRARSIDGVKEGTDGYWSRIIELGARAFENYVIHKMQLNGYDNDYLANVVRVDSFNRDSSRFPYLLDEEVAPVAEAFDNLFSEIQTKETDSGNVVMFSRNNATKDIPDAIILNELGSAKNSNDYELAKSGDVEAATRLAKALVTDDVINQLRSLSSKGNLIAGVTSIESTGNNALPEAAALLISEKLGIPYDENLVQSSSPKRTGMNGLDRIFNRPLFEGDVVNGAGYIFVDDTITQGGTFASLSAHVKDGGGAVVANIALTGKQYSSKIALSEDALAKVRTKFGDLENEFKQATGYGYEGITASEARYLTSGISLEQFRNRITEESQKAASNPDSQASQRNGLDTPSFSSSQDIGIGLPKQSIQQAVNSLRSTWKNAPEIIVVDDMNDPAIRKAVRDENERQLSQGAQGQPEAFFDNGKVYIVASEMNSADDVIRVVFHEALGHYGLRGLYGKDLGKVLDQVAMLRPREMKAKAKSYGLDLTKASDKNIAAEEILAEMAQTAPNAGLVKRAIAAIRNFLRNAGVKLELSDNDIIVNYLLPARNFVVKGAGQAQSGKGLVTAFSRDSAQTENPNFLNWFGNSKVVDADGKPLVVYHGSNSAINIFDEEKSKLGFWFSEEYGDAEDYGYEVTEAYLSINNPSYFKRHNGDDGLAKAIAIAKENGHDGLIVTSPSYEQGGDASGMMWPVNYVAFKSGQIKSAIGNNGDFNPANPDIRFSRSSSQSSVPEETKAQATQRVIQDKFNRFKVLQDWVISQGVNLSEAADVFLSETLMSGRISTRKEDFREGFVKPLIERTQSAGITMEQVGDYLKVQHAPEANKRARELQGDVDATAYGISDADAAASMKDFKALPNFAELKTIANEWRSITDKTKQIKLDSGLLTPEMVAAWENTYDVYVPVKGGDDNIKAGLGKGLHVNGKTKQRLGHGLRDEAIIENILRDHESAITLDEKNRVGKALIKFALEVQNDDIITISKPVKRKVLKQGETAYVVAHKGLDLASFDTKLEANMYIQAQAALGATRSDFSIDKTQDPVRVMLQASPMLADNEVNVYIAGHAVRVQINDEIAAREYKNLGVEHLNSILGASREINNFLSKVYTGYSPDFILTNPIRDAIQGFITLTGNEGFTTAAKIFANYPNAVKELVKHFKNKGASSLVNEYRAMGGSTGGAYLSDLERIGNDIQASFDEYSGAKATYARVYTKSISEGKSKKTSHTMAALKSGISGFKKIPVIGHFLSLMENINSITENALRVATYKTLSESGMSKAKSAAQAKNLMNFNRKGEKSNAAGALYLFFNPSIQGTKLIYDALFDSPHKNQARALAGSMTLAAITVGLMQLSGDDEDKEKWNNTPDYVKDGNLVIDMFGVQVTITLPYGYRMFWTLGNVMLDAQQGKDLDKLAIRLASSVFENVSAIGKPIDENGDINLFQVLPTTPKMAVGATELVNQDNFGNPITPRKWKESTPDSQLMNRGTYGSLYDTTASGLNSITGGSDFEAGLIDVSPETLKYWVKSLTGGTGQFVLDSGNIIINGLQGVAPQDARDIPVVRRFVRETGIRDLRAAFWERKNEADVAAGQLADAKKARDIDAFTDLADRKGVLANMAKASKRMIKMANVKRDLVAEIKADETLSLSQKIDEINKIEKEEAEIYNMFISMYDDNVK